MATNNSQSMNRYLEPGWILLGMRDKSERRGVWVRSNWEPDPSDSTHNVCSVRTSIEVCYGREGDDHHFVILPDSPMFKEMLDLVTFAEWIDEMNPAPSNKSNE